MSNGLFADADSGKLFEDKRALSGIALRVVLAPGIGQATASLQVRAHKLSIIILCVEGPS